MDTNRVLAGQISLVACFAIYLVWWYRGYRPGVVVSRIGGANGALLLAMVMLGAVGIWLGLAPIPASSSPKIEPTSIAICALAAYIVLLLVTRFVFHRVVTTELILIVGWTALEVTVIVSLNAAGILSEGRFLAMCVVLALAFVVSVVLYVAYYRMEEMRAFYAAMVPLVVAMASMAMLVALACER